MSPARGTTARHLGPFSAAALVVANTVGVGVFTTSGFALADLGSPGRVLLAWLVGGVVAACGAWCYAAIATALPESGGEYTFLARTVHPLAGFLAGWVSLLAGFTGPIAAAALGLAAYVAPVIGRPAGDPWIGTAGILLAVGLHGLRAAPGVRAQDVAVAVKLLLVTGFCLLGAWQLVGSDTGGGSLPGAPVDFPWTTFGMTLVWVSFSYSGWNAAVYVGGEVRDPTRSLRRALLLGTGVIVLVYLGLNAVFVHAAPVGELAGQAEIGAAAARALGGPGLERAVRVVVALALWTSVSAMVMAGPRVAVAMARDGLLPRPLGRGDPPVAALLLQAGLAILVVWLSDLAELLGTLGMTLGLCAVATVFGGLRHARRAGTAGPGVWIPAALFGAATLATSAALAVQQPRSAALSVGLLAAGLPAWWLLRPRTPR